MILLLEDDKNYADLLVNHIKGLGLEIVHKVDLFDLNPIARIGNFDMIILDYYLNYLSGAEIASFIKNISEEDIPVVMISADKNIEKKIPEGVRLFFHKSRPMSELADYCLKEVERMKLMKYYQGSR